MNKLRLQIRDFKAIAHADIEVEGITVIAGVNGSGKSTLSKLFYYIIKLSLKFEENQESSYRRLQNKIIQTLKMLLDEYHIDYDANWFDYLASKRFQNEDYDNYFSSLLDRAEALLKEHDEKMAFNSIQLGRMAAAFNRPFLLKLNSEEIHKLEDIFSILNKELENRRLTIDDLIRRRPIDIFEQNMQFYFKTKNTTFQFDEDITPIIDKKSGRFNNIYSLENIFYSDTPMTFSVSGIERRLSITDVNVLHWKDLKEAILDTPDTMLSVEQESVNEEIKNIISGEVKVNEDTLVSEFTYTRSTDDLKIGLNESATGIKSFAVLQMMLNKGLLNDRTLLIIDEPETHLHPQWIVEYARIIILLNKKLGVKIMIASHNPDMISAIRYISERESVLDTVCFYLAEKIADSELYNYQKLETDIEPIFESFNIALDRIADYGV